MKVLYLEHPESDFLATHIYLGLCEELGPDNVVDYPYKRSYHGETHLYPNPYPSSDTTTSGCTSPFAWMPAQPGREYDREEILAGLRDKRFDLVALASPRKVNTDSLRDIISTLGRSALPPLTLIDGEDYIDIRWDIVDEFQPRTYFKRELLTPVTDPRTKIAPLLFAATAPELPVVEKDIDVFFIAGHTWPARVAVVEALRDAFGDRFVGGINMHYDYPRYVEALNRSKIGVSVRGHGLDTTRFWDIPVYGTMLLSDRLPRLTPFPFEENVHAAYYNDTTHLVAQVKRLLVDCDERMRIATAGQAHSKMHHTTRARARQFLAAA